MQSLESVVKTCLSLAICNEVIKEDFLKVLFILFLF